MFRWLRLWLSLSGRSVDLHEQSPPKHLPQWRIGEMELQRGEGRVHEKRQCRARQKCSKESREQRTRTRPEVAPGRLRKCRLR